MTILEDILIKNKKIFGIITDYDYRKNAISVLDLTKNNKEILEIDTNNPEEYTNYKNKILKETNTKILIGRYAEDREIYRTSGFVTGDRRSIHLGIDLNMKAYSKIYCPYDGVVHSFKNNNSKGDYGPTIILEHILDGIKFYTLYGHLSKNSLEGLYVGKIFKTGEFLCKVGNYPVNGNRPPHLHFQIIGDMLGKIGDFYGVCSKKDMEYYLRLCPNPNYILQIPRL